MTPSKSVSETSALPKRYFNDEVVGHRSNTATFLLRFLPSFFSSLQEVNSVYRILSAILNTGNIEFASITSQHQTDKSEVPNSEALENGAKFYTSWPPSIRSRTLCRVHFIGVLCPRNESSPSFTYSFCSNAVYWNSSLCDIANGLKTSFRLVAASPLYPFLVPFQKHTLSNIASVVARW